MMHPWWAAGAVACLLAVVVVIVWTALDYRLPPLLAMLVKGPADRWRWKRRARRKWATVSEQGGLNRRYVARRVRWVNGWPRLVNVPKVARARLSRPRARGNVLELTVRHRKGGVNKQVLDAAEAIASALGGVEVGTSEPSIRRVVLEIVMRDVLTDSVEAGMPMMEDETGVVDLGREQASPRRWFAADCGRWRLNIRGQHTLILGVTGSGKGSVIGGILAKLSPSVGLGYVQLWGVDLKGGVEFSPIRPVFHRIAYTAAGATKLLAELVTVKEARTAELRQAKTRLHIPSPTSPLIVFAIDELAGFQYDSTPKGRQLAAEFEAMLGLLLTQGRALGIAVIAAQQDPRKQVLNLRDQFSQVILLRTKDAAQTALAMGPGSGIAAHLIREDKPGTAWIVAAERRTKKVRADYYPDELLIRIGERFPSPAYRAKTAPALPAKVGAGG